MTTVLIGGGWDPDHASAGYAPFLAAAGATPSIGCLVLDEGDGEGYFERFAAALTAVAPCRPAPLFVPLGAGFSATAFSAGSAIAAGRAVVGGYLLDGRAVCPADAAEDLADVTIVDGLGLVPFAVDVHAAQWGTLGRLAAAVAAGLVPSGTAIDEDTAVIVEGGSTRVAGRGAAHLVTPVDGSVRVLSAAAGGILPPL